MKTCHFTLEDDREVLEERAKHPCDFYPCDIPMVWVCSNCGAKFPPLVSWPPKDMECCPKCHAKVVQK